MFDTETRGRRNKRTSGDHPNYSIIKIGLNTKKSPKDLRKRAVTQTPVSNHRLRQCKKLIIIISKHH